MKCMNKECSWRWNKTSDVYHCDCCWTCPRRDSGEIVYTSNHTDIVFNNDVEISTNTKETQ